MSTLLSLGIGMALGFVFNFPPKKVQYVILGTTAIVLVVLFAYLLDNNALFTDTDAWSGLSILFNVVGYAIGNMIAWGMRKLLNLEWK